MTGIAVSCGNTGVRTVAQDKSILKRSIIFKYVFILFCFMCVFSVVFLSFFFFYFSCW